MVGTANEENAVPAARVKAVNRLDQPEARDLEEVLERLTCTRVPAGELAG